MLITATSDVATSIRRARRVVRVVLRVHGAMAAAPVAEVVTGELVANACRHAAAPYRRVVRCNGRALRVEVVDHSPALLPRPGSGYGWTMVRGLAPRHGVDVSGTEKRVWAQLALPAAWRPRRPTSRIHTFG